MLDKSDLGHPIQSLTRYNCLGIRYRDPWYVLEGLPGKSEYSKYVDIWIDDAHLLAKKGDIIWVFPEECGSMLEGIVLSNQHNYETLTSVLKIGIFGWAEGYARVRDQM